MLGEALLDTGCRLHAYVLMDNHVHLLTKPPDIGAVARLMQKLGSGYVGQFNARQRRNGTLWESRYKASLVDSESYILHCHRYIDLNPVRARMTDDPTTFAWSSWPSHCGLRQEVILSPHPQYSALGATPASRDMAPTFNCYARLFLTTNWNPSGNTSNNKGRWGRMTSAPWSKRNPMVRRRSPRTSTSPQ